MSSQLPPGADKPSRIYEITLDTASIARSNPNVDHEREVAIFDILDGNTFQPTGRDDGPYKVHLAIADDRLVMSVGTQSVDDLLTHMLPMAPLKRIIKDYFIICDTYYEAIKSAPPSRIQAIDMSRRSIHDEGSRVVMERLAGAIEIDFDTARRIFTLITALHWKG